MFGLSAFKRPPHRDVDANTQTRKMAAKGPQGSSTPSQSNIPKCSDRDSRISKDNLFMVLALWMERFPDEPEREKADPKRKVGAVLVLPTDMVYAVDCTRNGVHGVARLLMAHQDVLQDCKVFVSRKPCSLCTKLLVQSKVKRVFYLPIEPEHCPQYRENKDGKVIKWTKEEWRDFKDETYHASITYLK